MALQSHSASGKVLSYLEIEDEMIRLMNLQEEMTQRLADLAFNMSQAEANFKSAFHTARYMARSGAQKITADTAEDIAVMETSDKRANFEAARAQHDATKQAILTARSNLESLRSLMASYRQSGG